jgi:RNA polymerase sigma-70 factor (TIGR02957 family)
MQLSAHEIDLFQRSRPRLEAIAYRMLGSATDAEDVVQDTFLRWQRADRARVETPEAWLTKVLTNLCLTHLTSARARREAYVGAWLPEPVLADDTMLGPVDTVEQRESVSMAVLALMERLSPNERAVYVLREAFGYAHGEIAEILDVSEANCQQLYRRAKQHLTSARARVDVDRAAARRVVEEFLAAAAGGDTQRLVALLTGDATSIGDGGGKVAARTTPIVGGLAVARFLRGLFRDSDVRRQQLGGEPAFYADVVNGEPALVVVVEGRVGGVMCLELTADGVAAVRSQVNPDKLERLSRRWSAAGRAGDPGHIPLLSGITPPSGSGGEPTRRE